jgi:3-oxoadipate enol-lactonase
MEELRDVDVGGLRIAHLVLGDPDAPPMVLLHALGSNSSSWEKVATAFSDGYRVYAPDLRGHGASDWPGVYSFELLRDDVLGYLDTLGLDRVTLIGHSMGGSVAFLFAEEHPDRVERLVVEDTPPPFVGGDPTPVRPRPGGALPFDWAVIEAIVGQLNDPDPDWWDRASGIAAPTLIIAGGPDSHVPQDRIIEVAARIPDCKVVTIAAGHQVHRERPSEFIATAREFLSSTTS